MDNLAESVWREGIGGGRSRQREREREREREGEAEQVADHVQLFKDIADLAFTARLSIGRNKKSLYLWGGIKHSKRPAVQLLIARLSKIHSVRRFQIHLGDRADTILSLLYRDGAHARLRVLAR
jgi:hypothetical protein